MPTAVRFLRELRGCTRPCLVEADDGHSYVVKLAENPQHRRLLINEWIGCRFLRALGIATPETTMLYLDSELARTMPLGAPGWHFASMYPSDVAAFDVVPDSVLARVENLDHFTAAYVVDKWMGNTDMRQCIFVRDRIAKHVQNSAGHHPQRKGYVALMIDQDRVFNGWRWEFVTAAPRYALYFRPRVYSSISPRDFEPWFERVTSFPDSIAENVIRQIPAAWLQGTDHDGTALWDLIERLMHRRRQIRGMVLDCCRREPDLFIGCAKRLSAVCGQG